MEVKDIKNSKFLKDMTESELNELALKIRTFLLENVSKTGGHLSSNLGDVELIMSLHKVFDLENDKLLFDVGHQAYTHKILTGRASYFDTLRKIDGLSGFLSSSESKYDHFESGHSSTSISTAMGMALARDNDGLNHQIIALIGDASIANGVAFEAINNLANKKNKVIIVLNDNDMSIDKSIGGIAKSLSKVKSNDCKENNIFKRLFKKLKNIFKRNNVFDNFKVSYLGPVDGHNFKDLETALLKAKNFKESIVVHVKTLKGYGYDLAMNDEYGKYHGIAPFDLKTGEVIKNHDENHISFTFKVAECINNILNDDKDAYLICSAMVHATNLSECFEKYNDRCIDVGIAEEHAIALANGLALENKHPYVSMYSTFMQRGYDEIVHDVVRINSNVTFLIDRAGIVGEDGKTHQGLLDVSFLYPLSNSIIAMPSETKYIKPLLDCLNNIKGSKFVRYQKALSIDETYNKNIEFGKFIYEVYNKDNKITIIAVGNSCYKLKQMILKRNLNINLINPIFLKPLDEKTLLEIKDSKVYVYDNTSTYQGFASEVARFYSKFNKFIKCFTVDDNYVIHGKYEDVLKRLKLDEESILNTIIKENE